MNPPPISFQPLRDKLQALPVHGIIDAVVKDVEAGKVTIVAASTGSGKSMLLPGALADRSEERVVVLVPRRFLATDAAYNVAELANILIGEQVGYALGQIDGESSQRSDRTNLLYCTYGYALSSGLINKARTIVLDEVHEADEYISLARAVLLKRKTNDPALRILEMSATVNAEAQARYWQKIAQTAIHRVEGQALACDIVHESTMLAGNKDRSAEEITLSLLEQGRKGIALFRPGVKEVENSVLTLKQMLATANIKDVEVVGIHGGTPSDERRIARRAPTASGRKIIVGTNVIESGVNLRWLDAAISDGYRKIPYHRDDTGAEALVREDLPQAGLLQQIGRVNRDPAQTGFERGLYFLHAKKPFDLRNTQNGPAIQRQSLNGIAFTAASLGHNPTSLTWDINSNLHAAELPARLDQAKQELMQLQLVNDDWSLTHDGAFIKHLPVSPETGAMLCEAKRLDDQRLRDHKPPRVMRDIVIIAAVLESHGLRLDSKKGHKGDQHHTSDLLDAMNAFRAVRKEPIAQSILDATEKALASLSKEEEKTLQGQRLEFKTICEKHNVSPYGFVEVARLSDEITSRLGERDKGVRSDARDTEDKYDAERYGEVQRCILSAYANQLFIYENDGLRDLLRDFGKQRSNAGLPFNGYTLSHSSIVAIKDGALVVGRLRELPPKQAGLEPLLVLTHASIIPPDIFIAWAIDRAAQHAPVLSSVTLSSGGTLTTKYMDKAEFEIPVAPNMRVIAKRLITQ